MPRYSPLPSVSIDPRNEAQLVQDASQVVYDASNQTLNDFSSGNPLAALIEGQAFAQGEFLYWANQLPQKILIEWIGPFLGAMRRLGTPATARLLVSVPPQTVTITIPEGTSFIADANLTGGEAITFVTDQVLIIPPGETSAYVSVFSQFVGAQYNVPANTITGVSAINVDGLSATNPDPAVGGSDVETFSEVQERFFTLIRRRNPVSAEDWGDFFEDLYGTGTQTSVQPNRTTDVDYNYLTDYILPNGQVSFFVLGPNGVELTPEQITRGQNVINFSLPVQGQGHLYPITLSQVQYNIKLTVDANGSFGSNLRDTSLNFRDRLFQVLQPGNVFPASLDPSVGDVNSALYATFDEAIRFSDPVIETASAYNTPSQLAPRAATYTQVYEFEPREFLLNKNDLVTTTKPVQKFYPVLSSFTPTSSEKKDQTIYGNLQLTQIKLLSPGQFYQGDLAFWAIEEGGDDDLHVVLQNVVLERPSDIVEAVLVGKISSAKAYSPWATGTSYVSSVGGAYNPDIVEYDYEPDEFFPTSPSIIPVSKRPGALAWIVNQDFVLNPSTNDLTGASTQGLIDSAEVVPSDFIPGNSYSAGTWVKTLQVGSGPNPEVDPFYYYVDVHAGAAVKYAYVEKTFTYRSENKTVSEYFDQLVEEGILKEVDVEVADISLPIFQYKPRFPVGQYLEYRSSSIDPPTYVIAATYFTPTSTDLQDLKDQGLVIELAVDAGEKETLASDISTGAVKTPVRMFTFFKGDRTYFRQNTKITSYTANSSVTPLFEFSIYLRNGVFSETFEEDVSEFYGQDYIPFFSPAYANFAEDTILAKDGKNLYRVMRAFTPSVLVTNWTEAEVVNTARIQEYQGNLLRYVREYSCDEDILSPLGKVTSAIKLGVAQITLIPKSVGQFSNAQPVSIFVWENSPSFVEVPQLSWYTGTAYPYAPPNYEGGTLSL